VVSGAVACTFVAYYNVEKDRLQTLVTTKQKTIGKPSLGGPWSLVDMHGRPVTDADYRGKHVLFYYGFTRCPDICPRLFQLSLRACINGTGRLYLITVGPFGVWETRYTSGTFG
jgi:cytochrome oxidase Cu insertion factor (SCO1/SenC/PrrC family)